LTNAGEVIVGRRWLTCRFDRLIMAESGTPNTSRTPISAVAIPNERGIEFSNVRTTLAILMAAVSPYPNDQS